MADQEPQAVIGLAFGIRNKGEPDLVNEELAKISDLASDDYNRIPVILQHEIAQYSYLVSHTIAPKPNEYLDTYGMLAQAKEYCQTCDISRIVLVCADQHAFRCVRVAEKLGFTVCKVFTLRKPWDPQSTQWWTRGPIRFLLREIPTSVYYAYKGWM